MKEKDDCQICKGKNGGAKGNENIVDGIVMCDYCSAKRNKDGMSEQEIIIRWKQNDRYFASPNITDEMREWAMNHKTDMQGMYAVYGWLPVHKDGSFTTDTTYRLRSDFELPKEPKYRYFPITKQGTLLPDGTSYCVYKVCGFGLSATEAQSMVGFEGYTLEPNDCAFSFVMFGKDLKYVKIRKDAK